MSNIKFDPSVFEPSVEESLRAIASSMKVSEIATYAVPISIAISLKRIADSLEALVKK